MANPNPGNSESSMMTNVYSSLESQNNISGYSIADDDDTKKKYKGVRKRKWGKWVSEIRLPNCRDRIWLGSFDTAEKAARAFDAAQFCLRGRYSGFNFPESPPEIPGGEFLSPQEIQAVATKFANEYHRSDAAEEEGIRNPNYLPPLVASSHDDDEGATSGGRDNNNDDVMDWSFLNVLDENKESYNNNGVFSGGGDNYYYENFDPFISGQLYKMHSGEFSHHPQIIPENIEAVQENNANNYYHGDDNNNYQLYSSQQSSTTSSFLWNF